MPQTAQDVWAWLVALLPITIRPYAVFLLACLSVVACVAAIANPLIELWRNHQRGSLAKRTKTSRDVGELNRIAGAMASTPDAVRAQGRKAALEEFTSIKKQIDQMSAEPHEGAVPEQQAIALEKAMSAIGAFEASWPEDSDLISELKLERKQLQRRAKDFRDQATREGTERQQALPHAFPEMMPISPGTFTMGSPESEVGRYASEGPQHEVRIDYAFELGKYPVTFAEWDAAIAAGARLQDAIDFGEARALFPVVGVLADEVSAYIAFLNDRRGLTGRNRYRLPSEAEWEYACRAGATTRWSFGDDETVLAHYAWFAANSDGKRHPVGEKRPNDFGLHDMHGNVWELCADHLHNSYGGAPQNGSEWTEVAAGEAYRSVIRGGAWCSEPSDLRAATRRGLKTSLPLPYLGFRVARTLD